VRINILIINEKALQLGAIHLELLKQEHVERLISSASDAQIWKTHRIAYHQEEIFKNKWLNNAFDKMQKQQRYALTVFFQNKIIGSSSYYDIDLKHKKMKIGYTWYHPQYLIPTRTRKTQYSLRRNFEK